MGEEIRNKEKILKIKKIDAEGKFEARWDDKLNLFFKVPKSFITKRSVASEIFCSGTTVAPNLPARLSAKERNLLGHFEH